MDEPAIFLNSVDARIVSTAPQQWTIKFFTRGKMSSVPLRRIYADLTKRVGYFDIATYFLDGKKDFIAEKSLLDISLHDRAADRRFRINDVVVKRVIVYNKDGNSVMIFRYIFGPKTEGA